MDRKPTIDQGTSVEAILDKTIAVLRKPGIILYPTDTIWGIGCDATQESAIERIFKLKKRPKDKPFILLVADLAMANRYVGPIHPKLDRLLNYHNQPLTVVYPHARSLPALAYAADGSVAVRIVKDPFCQQLIRLLDAPLVATSANTSEAPFPKHFGEISSTIISGVDFVTPIRQQDFEPAQPSVMVTLSDKDDIVFLRN